MMGDGGWTKDEKTTKKIRTVRDLIVYRKAFDILRFAFPGFCGSLLDN